MNLSHYVPLAARKVVGALNISPVAVEYVAHKIEQPAPVDLIAESAVTFLASEYFKNDWFKEQPVHSFAALNVGGDTIILMLERTKFGFSIVAPTEVTLADEYPDRRVIAEVLVESF